MTSTRPGIFKWLDLTHVIHQDVFHKFKANGVNTIR